MNDTEKGTGAHTSWEELGIANDFLFGKVMQDAELCKELLKMILPRLGIDRIEYPQLQKGIKPDADAKSVRLDVYVKDGKGTVYDVDYSDFQVIPINLFLMFSIKHFRQIYRNKFLIASY